VRMEELAIDDGWTQETAVRIEWGVRETVGEDWELEDDELEDEEEANRDRSERGLDDGQGRLAEHYLRTVQCLARDVETSKTWLGRRRRSHKKKAR
jgi:hypothetical protein